MLIRLLELVLLRSSLIEAFKTDKSQRIKQDQVFV